jgi:hypothetical protein
MPLITMQEANDQLRLDLEKGGSPPAFIDDRVPGLQTKIIQAEAIILNYLKVTGDPDGSPPLWSDRDRAVVQSAAFLALSALYDDAPERTLGDYLAFPNGTISLLLSRLRDPTLA